MNGNYKFRSYVELPSHDQLTIWFEVDAFLAKTFEPYDLCSDAVTAMMAQGVTPFGAARIDMDRENLAKDISESLTTAIMKAIKANDLRNGYKQETEP